MNRFNNDLCAQTALMRGKGVGPDNTMEDRIS